METIAQKKGLHFGSPEKKILKIDFSSQVIEKSSHDLTFCSKKSQSHDFDLTLLCDLPLAYRCCDLSKISIRFLLKIFRRSERYFFKDLRMIFNKNFISKRFSERTLLRYCEENECRSFEDIWKFLFKKLHIIFSFDNLLKKVYRRMRSHVDLHKMISHSSKDI